MDRFAVQRLVDRAVALINDQSLEASDKLWRVGSFASKQVYRALFKQMFGKGANSGDEILTKKAVIYGIVRNYTPPEKWNADWMVKEDLDRFLEEVMTEEAAKAEKKKVEKKPGEFGKKRDLGIGDDVAKELAGIPTVQGMVDFAKKRGMEAFKEAFNRGPETDKEKVLALQDADKYLKVPNPGLTRMSIGNRLRGMAKKLSKKQDQAARKAERDKQKASEKAAKEKAKADKAAAQVAPEDKPRPKLARKS